MTRGYHRAVRRLLLAAVLAASLAVPAANAATPPPLPSHAQVAADRATFLKLAVQGMLQTRTQWWNPQAGWYKGNINGDPPVASLWSSYPLMAATAAVAIALPTKANKQAVDTIAKRAEGFWDPTLGDSGGVSWLFGLRNTGNAYFDDTGWWGVAYLDAYRATGNKRWLFDASRALGFIDQFGRNDQGAARFHERAVFHIAGLAENDDAMAKIVRQTQQPGASLQGGASATTPGAPAAGAAASGAIQGSPSRERQLVSLDNGVF